MAGPLPPCVSGAPSGVQPAPGAQGSLPSGVGLEAAYHTGSRPEATSPGGSLPPAKRLASATPSPLPGPGWERSGDDVMKVVAGYVDNSTKRSARLVSVDMSR